MPSMPYFLAHLAAMAPDILLMFLHVNKGYPSKKAHWNFQALLLAVLVEAMTPSCIAAGSPPHPAGSAPRQQSWMELHRLPALLLAAQGKQCLLQNYFKVI